MKSLSQPQMKRITAVHGWSGTLLGLLLYAVVLTGTIVVFRDEIAEWSIGGSRADAPLSAALDGKVRPAIDLLSRGYTEEIGIWATSGGELMVFPHAHVRNPETGEPGDFGTLFRLDPASGEILSRREGFLWQEPSWYEDSALRQFLIELHVQLSVPEPWGLLLTGILGLAMMAAGITGFMMHRHLIRDIFVAERPGGRLVSLRDRHVLAASWGLPFAFLLGFTGAFFSFAGTVGLPLLAGIAFGGDQEAMIETLYEAPVAPDPRAKPMADLDGILAASAARAGSPVAFVNISNYGRADSRVRIWHDPPDGRLGYVQHIYSGSDGGFLDSRPIVGNQPSSGATLYGLMRPLHFGDFAGLLSKAAWGALGAAMSFIILSGLQLWLRRRAESRLWRVFARATTIVAWGLPLAILASACAFFLSAGAADPFWWTPAGFVAAAIACIAAGAAANDGDGLTRAYRWTLAAGCLAMPVLRMATGGTGWAEAVAGGQGAVLSLDLLFLLGGTLLFAWKAGQRTSGEDAGKADSDTGRQAGPQVLDPAE